MPTDQRGVPCRRGRSHRFTVTSSMAGWKNCWYCGASTQVSDGGYWAGRVGTREGRRRR